MRNLIIQKDSNREINERVMEIFLQNGYNWTNGGIGVHAWSSLYLYVDYLGNNEGLMHGNLLKINGPRGKRDLMLAQDFIEKYTKEKEINYEIFEL